jgi:hypothetical protein
MWLPGVSTILPNNGQYPGRFVTLAVAARAGRLFIDYLHEDDLVGHVLGQEQWEVLSFPAIAETDEEAIVIGKSLNLRENPAYSAVILPTIGARPINT